MQGLSKLRVPSTTPQVSTVSAACLASTVPLTSRWTHPMSVAVSRAVFLNHGDWSFMVWLGEEVGKSQCLSCCISQTSLPQEVRP